MRIFHIALAADWEAARASGRYTVSTLGRSLAEEGFIHASRGDQWQRIRDQVYGDVAEPLVLLTIDTDLLDAPVVDEPPDPARAPVPGEPGETYPHIYGVLPVEAVVRVMDLGQPERREAVELRRKTFMQLFLEEMFFRAALGFAAMVFAGVVGFTAQQRYGNDTGFVVTVAALALALAVAFVVARRRDRRIRAASGVRPPPLRTPTTG